MEYDLVITKGQSGVSFPKFSIVSRDSDEMGPWIVIVPNAGERDMAERVLRALILLQEEDDNLKRTMP